MSFSFQSLRFLSFFLTISLLCGLSTSAPIALDSTSRSLVVRRHDLGPRYSAHDIWDAVDKYRYDTGSSLWLGGDDWDDDLEWELKARSYYEPETEIVERRSIGSWFRNLGKKIKHGFQSFGHKVKAGFQKAGKKIKEGFQKAGKKIKQGFQKVGKKIKKGFQTAGKKIKQGFKTAGKKIKEGFKKAGKWIKTTGKKVAKFGLKVAATATSVVSKVARFIPGVGTAASMGLKGAAIGLNKASDAIHANLGHKLEKGMRVMNKIQHPIGTAAKGAGKVLGKIL